MRFKLVENIEEQNIVAGDVVFLRKDMPYKNDNTKRLVDSNHQFFVLASDEQSVLLLMTTTSTIRQEKYPEQYVRISGAKRDFFVETDTWGEFSKDYVQRVSESVSEQDYLSVYNSFLRQGAETDLKLESKNKRKK